MHRCALMLLVDFLWYLRFQCYYKFKINEKLGKRFLKFPCVYMLSIRKEFVKNDDQAWWYVTISVNGYCTDASLLNRLSCFCWRNLLHKLGWVLRITSKQRRRGCHIHLAQARMTFCPLDLRERIRQISCRLTCLKFP